MKILLIDVNCKNSSTGKIVFDLYSYLNSHGDEAAICYGRGKKVKGKNIYKFGIDIETFFHALLTRITGFTGCFSFFSTNRLIRYIKKFKPDVVHIHELHAYFINIKQILTFLKKQNIKVVHTLHCTFSYTGKCGHHMDCNQWQTACRKCPRLKEYVSTCFFDNTKKMFAQKKNAFLGFSDLTIVTPSKWLADYVSKSFLNCYPTLVVNNGVDINVFHPQKTDLLRRELGLQDNEKVVIAVASHLMTEDKGGHYIVELAKELSHLPIRFILIGVDDYKEDLPNLICIDSITNQNKLAEFYSLADVFVICSKRETFSMTCAEAISCGTPVVGFECGAPETVFLSDCASFVEYGNIDALKLRLLEVLGRGKVFFDTQKYSVDSMCKQYFEVYHQDI